ncbi:MAG: S24/S26 family peptidase [Clostridia bacterium]|nr:S24/S26 family peptidase [Clostridia bacterium]
MKKSMEELLPEIEKKLAENKPFALFHRGTSMLPTLREGRDTVILARPDKIGKYDIVLYRRKNGKFVLHRIVKRKGGQYVLRGDNQFENEYGITKDMVIARAIGYFKGGKYISCSSVRELLRVKIMCMKREVKRLLSQKGVL